MLILLSSLENPTKIKLWIKFIFYQIIELLVVANSWNILIFLKSNKVKILILRYLLFRELLRLFYPIFDYKKILK